MSETHTYTLCGFNDHCLHSMDGVPREYYCCHCPGVLTDPHDLGREEKTHGGFYVGIERETRPGYPAPIEVPVPRTGDAVWHAPSGERWLVAWCNERSNLLGPSGWPETMAKLADCVLVRRASDEGHAKAVKEWVQKVNRGDARRQRVIRYHGGRDGGEDVSWNVYCTGEIDGNPVPLGHWDGTSNFNEMIRYAGWPEWHGDVAAAGEDGVEGRYVAEKLGAVLTKIREDPESVRRFESPNGWGTLEDLTALLAQMHEVAALYPSARWTMGSF